MFRRRCNLFFKIRLKFFDDASRHPADAYNAGWYAGRPIRRCIINLHQTGSAKLKQDKAPGDDGITPKFLKEVEDELTEPLSEIFNSQ